LVIFLLSKREEKKRGREGTKGQAGRFLFSLDPSPKKKKRERREG